MVTCTAGFEAQVREFVARKHGVLYRRAWEWLLSETPIGATDLPKSEQIAQISAKAEIQQRRWSLFAVRPL
jgi:hypothetical protein